MEMQRNEEPSVPSRPEGSVLALAAAQLRATADVLCLLGDHLGTMQGDGSLTEIIGQAQSLMTQEKLLEAPISFPSSDGIDGFAEHLLKIKLRTS
jgi:hypothetical protein